MTAFHRPPAYTILLIGADSENRGFFKQEFESERFLVMEAEHAPDALEALKVQKIDVVLVDNELSAEEKHTLMGSLRSEKYGDPIVFLLASPYSISREEAYDLGADAILSKPIDPQYLISRIKELLVPANLRWKTHRDAVQKPMRRQKTVSLSLAKHNLGRGGFTLSHSFEEELLEGDAVEFNVEVDELCTLRGTGIIRYVKLDKSKRRQKAWGVEYESLDDQSLESVLDFNTSHRPISYIPRCLH